MRRKPQDVRREIVRLLPLNKPNQLQSTFPNQKGKNKKMNIKTILCAAAVCGGITVATAADEAVAEAEKGEIEETPIVSAEFGLSFDSKYMTYGVIDGNDPILTPSASITFFDWVYFGVEAIFDTTKGNGKRGGYGNRAFKYTTLDSIVGLAHDFDLNEDLGALSVDFNYIYEYLPRYHGEVGDTQYLNLELSLGDLWLEPTLAIERDLMADDGTYVNFEIGHTFTLVGDDDDPTLTFRPSVGQGFGNTRRNKAYLGKDKGGLMDTALKGELEWNICENVALGAYVAYYDYWFDSRLRDGARDHNAEVRHPDGGSASSYNFVGGLSVTVSF